MTASEIFEAGSMDDVWYVARAGQPYGPISTVEFAKLVEFGHLQADDLVWRQGWADWNAGQVVLAALRAGELQLTPALAEVWPAPQAADDAAKAVRRREDSAEPAQILGAALARMEPAAVQTGEVMQAPAEREISGQPDAAAPSATEARLSEPRRGYLSRHWRGEFGLGRSLWINFLTLDLLLAALFYLLVVVVLRGSMPLLAAAFSALTLFIVPLSLWQIVGVWRSAGRGFAVQRWAGPLLARAMMVLALGGVGGVMVRNVQMTKEFLHIAAGDGDLGRRSYDIVLGGRELIVSGGISFGLADEVRRKLENNPQIKVIRLESSGGRVGPARELRSLIRDRQLSTYTAQGCFSACAVAFLGGSERVIREGARIGFHRPSFPGMRPHELIPEINVERGVMAALGVPSQFIEKAFATPAAQMWTPTPEELLAAHVVTRITQGTDFGVEPPALADLGRMETALLENPLYAAIKSYDPAIYQDMMQDVRAGLLQGMSPDHFAGVGLEYSAALIARNAPTTSNEAILAYAKAELQLIRKLESRGAGYCYASVFHVRTAGEGSEHLPSAGVLAMVSQAAARVIEDAALRPSPAPTSASAESGRNAVERAVAEKHGDDAMRLLNARANGQIERIEACMLMGTVLEAAVRLPSTQAGPFLRQLLPEIIQH